MGLSIDRVKIINGIEVHLSTDDSVGCDACTYENDGWCTTRMLADALSLLKEQDAEVEWCARCGRVRLKSKWEGR